MFEIPKTGRKKFWVLEELQDMFGPNVENTRQWYEMRVDGEKLSKNKSAWGLVRHRRVYGFDFQSNQNEKNFEEFNRTWWNIGYR